MNTTDKTIEPAGGRALRVRDSFAGTGWGVAIRQLGWHEDGIEKDDAVRATRDAEDMSTIAKDVRDVEPTEDDAYDIDAGSPPCQTFCATGTGTGRRAYEVLLEGVTAYRNGNPIPFEELAARSGDERTALVLEPLRYALGSLTRFLAWEQAPEALPVWRACVPALEDAGYSVAVGILFAEQYGVPQTRKRAVLVARRDGKQAQLPTPTHSLYHRSAPERLDPGVLPWVTSGETLGWPHGTRMVSNYGTGGDPKKRGVRWSYQPAATMTGRADRIKVYFPDGTVRNLTLDEAAALQNYPPGFRFQGKKAEIGQHVGNAVPIKLATAILRTFIA